MAYSKSDSISYFFIVKKIKQMLAILFGFVILGFVCIYRFVMVYMPTSSIVVHMNGFVKGMSSASLFGYGLGKAGTMTGQLSGTNGSILTAESYIGTLIAQIGIVGFAIFFIFWLYIILRLIKRGIVRRCLISYGSAIMLVSVLVESLWSESSIAIVGSGLYFVYAGIGFRGQSLTNFNNILSRYNVGKKILCKGK